MHYTKHRVGNYTPKHFWVAYSPKKRVIRLPPYGITYNLQVPRAFGVNQHGSFDGCVPNSKRVVGIASVELHFGMFEECAYSRQGVIPEDL